MYAKQENNFIQILVKVFASLMLGLSLLHSAGFEKETKARDLKVMIVSEKPLSVGSNRFVFSVFEKGQPLKDAVLSVKAFMPAMPGMPAMESTIEAKNLGEGKYEAKLNFSMGGTWQLHIFVTPKAKKTSRIKTSLNI